MAGSFALKRLWSLVALHWKLQDFTFFWLIIHKTGRLCGVYMKAWERGTFRQLKVYKRHAFSIKMVYKRVRGWTLEWSLSV